MRWGQIKVAKYIWSWNSQRLRVVPKITEQIMTIFKNLTKTIDSNI